MTAEYFTGLNYSLANEDNQVEYELVPPGTRSILSISGSGARAVPLLAKNPELLEIADLSREQLHLAELRVAAIRALEYREFLYFMGYRGGIGQDDPGEDSRLGLLGKLRLSAKCREFWRRNEKAWTPRGFLYLGKWESHFMKLGRLLRRAALLDAAPLFSAHTLEEQLALYHRHWSPRRFHLFLRLALSDFVFNRYLYKGHYAGGSSRRTVSTPAWDLVYRELTKRFTGTLIRKNFFLQMVFLGELRHEEGFPPEARPDIFEKAKSARTEVRFTLGNFLELTRAKPYGYYSLSDTISYVSEEDARGFVAGLHADAPDGSLVVIRSFMRQPHIPIGAPWIREAGLERQAQERDCTGLYEFLVLRKQD